MSTADAASLSDDAADPGQAVRAFVARGGRLVSFDVFDTLLWRKTLFPHDLFKLLGPGPWAGRWRLWAERLATAACRRFARREPRLADVYRLCPFGPAKELQLERQLVLPNPACLAAVQWLDARRVPVVAVSDMYLSSAQIAALLAQAGYPPLRLFVSSDEQLSKLDRGRLFDRVLARCEAEPGSTLHLGDNPHADIAMGRRAGLAVARVAAPRERLLALVPELAQSRLSAQASLFWGQVAIALHTQAADERLHQTALPQRLRALAALAEDPRSSPHDLVMHALEAATA